MRFLLLLSFLLTSLPGFAQDQRYLALNKPSLGHKYRLYFYPNQDLTVRIKGQKKPYQLTIIALTDTSIQMGKLDIPLQQIEAVIVSRKGGLRYAGAFVLPLAGATFFLLDTFNTEANARASVSSWGIGVGGGLIGTGLLLRFTQKRSYKLGKSRNLKVLARP
jgi:hypothetical protein